MTQTRKTLGRSFRRLIGSARPIPIRTLALWTHARLLLIVQVFGQPLMLAPFALITPEGEFYFCHARNYTMKNICCQVIYSLT